MSLELATAADRKAARIWQSFDQLVLSYATRYAGVAERLLKADGLRAAEGFAEGGAVAMVGAIHTGPWLEFLTRLWITVTQAGGEFTVEDLKPPEPVPEAVFHRAARAWLEDNGAVHAQGIVDTTQETANRAVLVGVERNETRQGIAAMISASVRESAPGRAQNIARTETHSAANLGSLEAAEEINPTAYKIWIATPDNRTRDQHRAAHNQKVKITEPFIVGGERLMYPGHWSLGGSGWNIYGCRCAMRYIMQRRAR